MKPAKFNYEKPADLQTAIDLLAQSDGEARVLAGGQSLVPMMNLRLARPSLLVDIRDIPKLRACQRENGRLRIGATVTHAMVEDGKVPELTAGMLQSVARNIAYRAVRNRGTVGGSLAHIDPGGDWPSAMFALGIDVEAQGPNGRRTISIDNLFTGAFATTLDPSEILTGVLVPVLSPAARWGYYKVVKKAGDLADSIGAAVHDPERGISRVTLGSTDAPPFLLQGLSERLADYSSGGPSPEVASAAVAEARPDFDSVDRQIHATVIRRAIAQAFSR